jgi:hypothetical protein
MRALADEDRLRRFMRALGSEPAAEGSVFFTGGATAVLVGWRPTTIDADILVVPDTDRLLGLLPRLKEDLNLNIEIASPAHFLPELPGWRERSRFIAREGRVDFFHYDFYAQALSKVLRGYDRDLLDVAAMIDRGLVEREALLRHFDAIEPRLFRFPNIDPGALRRAVEDAVAAGSAGEGNIG